MRWLPLILIFGCTPDPALDAHLVGGHGLVGGQLEISARALPRLILEPGSRPPTLAWHTGDGDQPTSATFDGVAWRPGPPPAAVTHLTARVGDARQRWPVRLPPAPPACLGEATCAPADPAGRLAAQADAGRRAFRAGRLDAAVAHWRAAAAAADAADRPSDAAARWRAVAYVERSRHRFREATAALAAAAERARRPEDQLKTNYYGGLLAAAQGDFRRGAERLEAAQATARALGDAQMAATCALGLAELFGRLGRHADALRLTAEAWQLGAPDDPDRTHALAWAWLAGAQAGALPYSADALDALLAEAEAGYRAEGRLHDAATARADRAAVADLAGAAPQPHLAEARRLADPTDRWLDHALTRLEAAHAPDPLAAYARWWLSGAPQVAGAAWVGMGLALDAAGAATADAALAEALRLAEVDARRARLGQGRAAALGAARHAATRLVERRLRAGDRRGAVAVLDRVLAAPLRALTVTADPDAVARYAAARAAADAARRACVLASAAAQMRCRAQVAAAERRAERRFQALDRAEPSPPPVFMPHLGAGEALRVAFTGPAGPRVITLGATAPRHTYLVGPAPPPLAGTWSRLPYPSALGTGRPSAGPAVVVANPSGDLPAAGREGRAVATRLGVSALGAGTTRATLLAALRSARVFHFAGHGALAPADPWGVHLRLARGEALRAPDLLAAPLSVDLVVLSGCRTGAETQWSPEAAISLPAVLLLAGARAVVATTQPIDDQLAAAFQAEFYAADGARRPARALRAAVAALRARWPEANDAFELWGRPDLD